ncbi:MAG: DUF2480 family protein [Burkholderiales bacterium]|nr:DUF2480 family protein [Bacteroidia bacterium]
MSEEIINKVANSGLITIDLEELYPKGERVLFDLKPLLFHELILKEKDFRDYIKQHDWTQYHEKFVAIYCTADAIVPTWAYMLISIALEPFAKKIVFGDLETLESIVFHEALSFFVYKDYQDKRVVIKGCSNLPVSTHAYVELVRGLRPFAKSIMYGEPCSTVPLYKAPAAK